MTELALIGLDAADLDRLERLADAGRAPAFAALRSAGALGRLSSVGNWLPGSVWPSFFTSRPASETGFHHYLQWAPDEMVLRRPDPASVGRPFWRDIAEAQARLVVVDMPFSPPPDRATEVTGWATLDTLGSPQSCPASLLGEIEAAHGPSPRVAERHALQRPADLLRLRDQQIAIAETLARLSERLIARERPDIFALTFPGLHRGGHWLWDETGLAGAAGPEEGARLATALDDVYAATDAALGRVLDAAAARQVIAFSLHGMGPNTSRIEILDEMLDRVLAGGAASPRPVRLAERLRRKLPPALRHRVKDALPVPLQDRLTGYWRTGGRDWAATRAFAQTSDLTGYIRFNVVGREHLGALPPEAIPALAEEVSEGLSSFVDAESGAPLVAQVAAVEDILPPGPGRGNLPDLMVDWTDRPAARHRAVVSPRFGRIPWPSPGKHPSGRSGNHRAGGFYLATGPGLAAGPGADGDILDLAPTIFARLGLPVPAAMRGRPLHAEADDLAASAARETR
ncbi:MAG: hypothetical protein QNJ13_10480 [Paracoccaceae bacterium]|nr:hypothetical protein [Paracoccaceae bacterium]